MTRLLVSSPLMLMALVVTVSLISFGTSFSVNHYTAINARHQPSSSSSALQMNFMDDLQGFMKRFTTKATASHILIKGGAEAANKLEDLKVEINDDPVKFAQAASQYSECPSSRQGGNLGEFGPGAMVKEFDTVVFNDEVGKVHGPVKTQFGYHLIYISDRTE